MFMRVCIRFRSSIDILPSPKNFPSQTPATIMLAGSVGWSGVVSESGALHERKKEDGRPSIGGTNQPCLCLPASLNGHIISYTILQLLLHRPSAPHRTSRRSPSRCAPHTPLTDCVQISLASSFSFKAWEALCCAAEPAPIEHEVVGFGVPWEFGSPLLLCLLARPPCLSDQSCVALRCVPWTSSSLAISFSGLVRVGFHAVFLVFKDGT